MKIVVFGPTGGTGRAAVEQAVAAGDEVVAFARRPDAVPTGGVKVVQGDALDADAVARAIAGADAVIASLGTRPWRKFVPICADGARNIVEGMKKHGVRRLVAVSSLGVGDSRDDLSAFWRYGLVPVIRRELRDKDVMEERIRDSGLDWVIVRPTVLTNGKPRGRVKAADDHSIRAGFIPRRDVAAFCLAQVRGDEWLGRAPTIT